MNKQSLKSIIIKHLTDIIVIASLLVLSISFLLVSTLTRKDGATAVITVGGVTVGEYPLDRNGEYTINNGTNMLTIGDGVAYMSYSSCPDHICENTGKVRYVGEQIVCLPNRVTVTVTGDAASTDGGVDFVS